MEKQYDVVAVGEPIIDFVERPRSADGNLVFEAFTGGGACNVLAQVCALGGRAAIVGAVGKDMFGAFLEEKLNAAGVATPALHRTTLKNTGIGFVHLSTEGERSFTFYRNPEKPVELFSPADEAVVAAGTFLHFTSVSLPGPSLRDSTFAAVDCARRLGVGVSFDVNHRPTIWPDPSRAREFILEGIRRADVVKLSEEERAFLYGAVSNEECARILHREGVALAAISMGEQGSFFSYAGGRGTCGSLRVEMVDSTGCGDAFAGALLAQLSARGGFGCLNEITPPDLRRIMVTANVAGALCASRHGSFTVMPRRDEIDAALRSLPAMEKE